MATQTETTDKATGLGLLLGVLAALGAGGMFFGAPEPIAGWAFAAAMTFGALAIVGIHLWE